MITFLAACSLQRSSTKKDSSIEELQQNINLTVSNWDKIISTADLSYENIKSWLPERGIRGRYELFKKYLSKSILENIVGEKAFLEGPHVEEINFNSLKTFGKYNPVFLTKLGNKLKVLFANETFIKNTQSLYDSRLKKYLQVYYLSYNIAANNEEIMNGYLNEISYPYKNSYMNGRISGPSYYLQESFRGFAESIENDGYDVYEGFICPGFWVRRSIDGTSDEFYDLLVLAIKIFDPKFISS